VKGPRGQGVKGSRAKGDRFAYFLETIDQPLTSRHPLWPRPLPLSRESAAGATPENPGFGLSIGEYFEAVRTFLEGPGKEAVSRLLGSPGAGPAAAVGFDLFLSKHGEFYHPCRVAATAAGRLPLEFVLNVAVSGAGKAIIRREYALLDRLNRIVSPGYVPEVYVMAEVPAARRESIPIFMGQWFSGYREFHLTRSGPEQRQGLVIWDPENGARFPGPAQTESMYATAAGILTHYYNIETSEGIGAWHHAAGDFVVRMEGADVDLRLVTVREYRPMFPSVGREAPAAGGAKARIEALLVFFLNLSLRMRIDRLDGTGEMAWAGPFAVRGALRGALDALARKPALPDLPLPLDLLFKHVLLTCGADDLRELCEGVVSTYPPQSPEALLARSHIPEHVAELSEALCRL
jgi:hypothetical protein